MPSPEVARGYEDTSRSLDSIEERLQRNILEWLVRTMHTQDRDMLRLVKDTAAQLEVTFDLARQLCRQAYLDSSGPGTPASAGQSTPDRSEADSPQKAPREFAHQTYAVEISIPRKWIEDWLQSVLPDRYSHEDLEKFRASELEELLRKVLP